MTTRRAWAVLESVETALSTGPFGDGDALASDIALLYACLQDVSQRLGALIDDVPNTPSPARIRARCALDEFAADTLAGLPTDAAIMRLQSSWPNEPRSATSWREVPTDAARLLAVTGWDDAPTQWVGDRLVAVMRGESYPLPVHLLEPTADVVADLGRAIDVAFTIAPRLCASTFPLVDCVSYVDGGFPSMYLTQLPYVVMIGPEVIDNPVLCGDGLLHESLHQKLADLRLTRHVMRPEYDDRHSPRVQLPWSVAMGDVRRFTAGRVISTYHVYVQLVLYYARAVWLRADGALLNEDVPQLFARMQRSLDRAMFLKDVLAKPAFAAEFGADGIALIAWLTNALEETVGLSIPGGAIEPRAFLQEGRNIDVLPCEADEALVGA